jgi:putative serine protease PepD
VKTSPLLLAVGLLAGTACSSLTATSAGTGTASPGHSPVASAQADQLQSQLVQVVHDMSSSVVLIDTGSALGSGVVFDSQGDVVTNNHVVQNATSVNVFLTDGTRHPASVVGTFAPDDLAVVRIQNAHPRPATFGDSSKLQVGDIVLAIGNPLGLQSSVTEGIVSAVGRNVSEPGGVVIPNTIQTSAAINPGNSGGALVDLRSEVVGIPTLAAVDQQIGGAAPGIGFAISSNMARDIASQLIANGKVTNSHRAYLGVEAADTTAGGVLVVADAPGGPAARAGITAGDLITAVAGHQTPDSQALGGVLASLKPGQQVDVALTRQDGSKATVKVTLGTLPGG